MGFGFIILIGLTHKVPAKRENRSLLKVFFMSLKRLFLVILMLVIGCQQASVSQEKPAEPANANETAVKVKPDEQLDIMKYLLLTADANDQMRTKTVNVLLYHENPAARKILIDILGLTNNSAARMAVCRALIQSRTSSQPLENKTDFIQPLLGVFNTDIEAEAQLAADATLIFEDYEIIRESLETLVTDSTRPVKTRLNAIKALKRRPDMVAAIKLIELVDDPDESVSQEAEKALYSIGIPVGESAETRRQSIIEMQRKGPNTFLLSRLINQETQISQIRAELESWKDSHLALLSKTYKNTSDDTVRGKFLVDNLSSPKSAVKLWALEQVVQWIRGTNRNYPKELDQILIGLISDQDKAVRQKTAELLASIRTLNSASELLAQFKIEPDNQVKGQLLNTLGWVCSYALSSSSSFKIPPEIRQQVLDLAAEFLLEEDANKTQIGAQVMRQLLERDSLKPEEVDKKLNLLVERYIKQKEKLDETLRGGLLSVMAGLVAKDSACKAKAETRFEQYFLDALNSKTDFVREAAVDGLGNIDQTKALTTLRKKSFYNDTSSNVRSKLIVFAKNVGGSEDLNWLVEKIGSNSESNSAWQAMLRIFNDSDVSILAKWEENLTGEQSKLSDNQKIDFLKIEELKVIIDKDKREVREKLSELLYNAGQFDQAADYLGRLLKTAQSPEDEKIISSKILDSYLRWPNLELAADLIKNCLTKGDLEPDDVIIRSIDNYLSNQPDGTDTNAVLTALTNIETSSPRPRWRQKVEDWTNRFMKTSESDEPEIPVNQ